MKATSVQIPRLSTGGGQGVNSEATETEPLKAPFPYPGGKSRVADAVWERLGDVANYIEPFAGSLAVLLRRPASHFTDGYRIETVNDVNRYIVNFWRAVAAEPERVAHHADWPVHEADLHARHRWLMRSDEADAWRTMMIADPTYYDAKIAGWWAWGQCCWIGSGWCNEEFTDRNMMPIVNCAYSIGQGVNSNGNARPGATEWKQPPRLTEPTGVLKSSGGRPQLADAFDIGRGVNGNGDCAKRTGSGVLAESESEKRSNFSFGGHGTGVNGTAYAGTCAARREWLTAWLTRLSDRLRLVRTCYGHWNRVCNSDSTLTRLGVTGVFLDPPYPLQSTSGKKSRAKHVYATDGAACLNELRDEVLAWCREWGTDKQIRIAVCGYEGDGYEPLEAEGWGIHSWEANGGYANQSGGGKGENAKRERIWFSPNCVKAELSPDLFSALGVE